MKRRRFYLIGFGALAILDTVTQISLKLTSLHAGPWHFAFAWFASALRSPWTWLAVAGYIGAFAMWMTLLEHAPVGPAFAASHVDVVTVLLISVPLFGERLSATQLAGAALILAGIACLSVSEDRAASAAARSISDALPARQPPNLRRSQAGDRAR